LDDLQALLGAWRVLAEAAGLAHPQTPGRSGASRLAGGAATPMYTRFSRTVQSTSWHRRHALAVHTDERLTACAVLGPGENTPTTALYCYRSQCCARRGLAHTASHVQITGVFILGATRSSVAIAIRQHHHVRPGEARSLAPTGPPSRELTDLDATRLTGRSMSASSFRQRLSPSRKPSSGDGATVIRNGRPKVSTLHETGASPY